MLTYVNITSTIGLTRKNMENKGKKAIYVSIPELAKMLGVSRVAVFNKIKKGQIPAHKIGRNYAISMEDVSDLVDGGKLNVLTEEKKSEIKKAVEKVVKEYGETLKLLGKE
jgi:excisionase family DNA binding protein